MKRIKEIFLRIVGVSFYKKLIQIKQSVRDFVLLSKYFFRRHPYLSSIYYAIISSAFHNEHFTVISGMYKNLNDIDNMGNFRRSIHRIEKGLITSPPKPEFAEAYIYETIQTLKASVKKNIDKSTLKWAFGILNQYFSSVKETAIIGKAKAEFLQINQQEFKNLHGTYKSSDRIKCNISYQEFFELNLRRRSIRYYQNTPVPRDLVEKAVEVALQAPSACNRQPFQFRIIDDDLLLRKSSRLLMGATTFSDNIKMIVFIIGDLSNYFDERDKHVIYIDSSLAAMNFVLALETVGLSSCIINWSDVAANNNNLKIFLELENWEQCVMSIAVGYADPEGYIPLSVKKEVKSIIKYNLHENTN